MKLEKFKEKNNEKRITIGISILLVLLIAGIIVYRSFAFYEEKKTFDVIKGQVPDQDYDLMLSFYVKDENGNITYQETMPEGKGYTVTMECNNGATGEWDYNNWNIKNLNVTTSRTKCKLIFTPGIYMGTYMSDYIIAESKTDETIVKLTQSATAQTGNNAITEYRYSGKIVNNWVCFGSEEATCPDDNLYRIIGVFPTQSISGGIYENRVKLIRNAYYTESTSGYLKSGFYDSSRFGYQWNSSLSNAWESSTLQKNVLNGVYWNSLGDYQKYIDTTLWYLGAPAGSSYTTYTSAQLYQAERSTTAGYSKGATSYKAYIGLMYPSDYGYSIDSAYWNSAIYTNKERYFAGEGWLYAVGNATGNIEWMISPDSTNHNIAAWTVNCHVAIYGDVVFHPQVIFGIRPSFYLDAEVTYKSGTGTSSDPYRLSMQ